MEAILFFVLLVAALLALSIIDMVSDRSKKKRAPGDPLRPAPLAGEPLVDATGRPLHGPALARARAARRAARKAAAEARDGLPPVAAELPPVAESAGK